MARKQRSQVQTRSLPKSGMQMGNVTGAGYLDPTLIPLPESSLAVWFADRAAVEQFSQPVRPRA